MASQHGYGAARSPWWLRHPISTGAGLGLVWGAAMRAWMRFVSTDPEFSWSGTMFILGAAAIAGASLGLARGRRRRGGAGWWRFSFASLLLLGAGGAVMWPSVVAGAVAIGRPWRSWRRLLLVAVAVAAQVPVINDTIVDNPRLSLVGIAVATVWYAAMLGIEAWGYSVTVAPSLEGVPMPGRVRRTLIAVPVALAALAAVLAAGLPG